MFIRVFWLSCYLINIVDQAKRHFKPFLAKPNETFLIKCSFLSVLWFLHEEFTASKPIKQLIKSKGSLISNKTFDILNFQNVYLSPTTLNRMAILLNIISLDINKAFSRVNQKKVFLCVSVPIPPF